MNNHKKHSRQESIYWKRVVNCKVNGWSYDFTSFDLAKPNASFKLSIATVEAELDENFAVAVYVKA